MVATNTGIFLSGLKLCGESRTWQVLLVSKNKIGGNHAFCRDNGEIHHTNCFVFYCFTLVIELSGVQFGLKSYAGFQTQTSAIARV